MRKLIIPPPLFLAILSLMGCGNASHDRGTGGALDASAEAVASVSSSGPTVSATLSSTSPVELPKPDISDAQVEAEQSPEMARCVSEGDAAKGMTSAMAACVHDELTAQDVRLNEVYKAVMATLDGPAKTRLRDEERAWLQTRDETCAAQAQGGTIDRILVPSCVLNETIRRRLILESMIGSR